MGPDGGTTVHSTCRVMGVVRPLAGAVVFAVAAGICTAEEKPAGTSAGQAGRKCDWPQFHGPRRDNISTETGLLKRWPAGGPKLLWKADGLGHGWATVALVGERIYTAGKIGPSTVITALDRTGKQLWQAKTGPAFNRSPPGARATPTIAAGRLYHLNGTGHVVCLDAATGERIWAVNMLKRFNGRNIRWGLSESLLVDGGRVICCPGGKEVSLVALDAGTGKTLWKCTGARDKPAYAAPILVDRGGLRQIVTVMGASAVGVAADTGRLLWQVPHRVRFEAACASPIHHGGYLALFGTWGRGATLLKLNVDGAKCTAEEVWRTKDLDNEHGGVVLVAGYLYGQADGDHKRRHWACLDFKTGRTVWNAPELAGRSGTLTYADGMLYLLSDRGTVALVPASPKGFEIVSRFDLPKGGRGSSWAHPVICGGRLYVRHGDFLYVYDVRKST